MEEMVRNLIGAYRARIKQLDWMTKTTKTKALKKLSTFRSKLVQPKRPRTYSELKIRPDRYLENVLLARQCEFFREMKKLSRPIDRNEWFMGAHVVNAYYWASQNEIVFPAGILQPPFFAPGGDVAMNYGSIGAVIGHELTHGFDDKGSLFDEKGNLKNWWTARDRRAFMKKTAIIKEQYSQFVVDGDLHVNGELTLGENIADLGGVVLAYDALQKYMKKHGRLKTVGGYTPEQRFFFGCVVSERGSVRKEAARLAALSDPHAPAHTRVNGPLAHLESFHDAFGVKPGDKMYRAPSARALIW
jgi:putative endopeptidase